MKFKNQVSQTLVLCTSARRTLSSSRGTRPQKCPPLRETNSYLYSATPNFELNNLKKALPVKDIALRD